MEIQLTWRLCFEGQALEKKRVKCLMTETYLRLVILEVWQDRMQVWSGHDIQNEKTRTKDYDVIGGIKSNLTGVQLAVNNNYSGHNNIRNYVSTNYWCAVSGIRGIHVPIEDDTCGFC